MCTRVLWNDNPIAVVAARSMDWPTTTEPVLTVFPVGTVHDGGLLAGHRLAGDNPFVWASRFGNVITSIYGAGTVDGVNERGLGGHALYLAACDFGEPDPSKPTVHGGLWLQLLLDQAATVAEAIDLLHQVQVTKIEMNGSQSNLHLAIEDASGDSAVIEFVDRQLVVHHGRSYSIMTNDPPFDEQLRLLAELDFSEPSRDMPLPGNVNARDRFQRAAYYRALLPEPKNVREVVAGALAIVRNASVPFGAPYGEFGVYNTEYRTVVDTTNVRYFFELTTSPNLMWVDLDSFDLSAGGPVLTLDPDDIALAGDVSARFTPVAAAPF
ncbi:MAG: linear amide C-N hydrolase [Actinobacteria bacterium]|nr:linear amide C-N hydrolase [Actinomycetota bacterium]